MGSEKIEILFELFENKFGIRLLKQIICVFLIILKIDESIIRANLGTDPKTIKKYSKLIEDNNIALIFKDNVYRQKSELDNYTSEIMHALEQTPPKTLREAAVIIEKTTGLRRSTNQVSNYLKKNGLKRLMVGFLPSKSDPKKQKNFIEDILKPLFSKAKKGEVQLFFVDASHFVMGGFVGYVWTKVRCFVKTSCGRSRYNVLGALNFASKKVTTITNDTYITSEQVVMLIDKLLLDYKGEVIKLVLDNVKYQRCKKVIDYALSKDVELIFLPTYSPNINLIERLWKFVKSEVLNSAYYGSFDDFKKSIDNCLLETNKKHIEKLNTLITENIQTFENICIIDPIAS